MPLNDPFGRVSRNDSRAYQALRDQLRHQGVDTTAAADGFRRNMRATLLRLTAAVTGGAAIGAILLPDWLGSIAVIAALALLWLASSYLKTLGFVRRYRREECTDTPADAASAAPVARHRNNPPSQTEDPP